MNCETCRARLDELVDGTLGEEGLAAAEHHLAACASCRAIAEDFREIRAAARGLERHLPSPQAWIRVEAALEAERNRGVMGRFFGGGPVPGWRPLATAAMLLLALGGSTWIVWRQFPSAPPAGTRAAAPAAPADAELAQTVENELKLAEEHYQKAIAGLEQITRKESGALDPQVAAVLQKNLEVIDQAIGESRAALQTQPANDVAQESLFEALRNKVTLLQDTVVLINEMRKGNQEGAARIVSGLNQ